MHICVCIFIYILIFMYYICSVFFFNSFIGKLCLQHVDLVEKSVVQMAMELEKNDHSVIRNNIIVVLCDLMVR